VFLFPLIDLNSVVRYVFNLLDNKLPRQYYYHNSEHTLDVFEATTFYCKRENLSKEDTCLASTAAVLHDCGFIARYNNNEPEASRIAKEILPQFGYNENHINVVSDCIMATKIPQNAQSKVQMIVCDSDLDYLGRTDYFIIAERLRKELAGQKILSPKDDWNKAQIDFLSVHKYYTKTAIELRELEKQNNINKLIKEYEQVKF
jgi:HD superfamily phosphodiesterase